MNNIEVTLVEMSNRGNWMKAVQMPEFVFAGLSSGDVVTVERIDPDDPVGRDIIESEFEVSEKGYDVKTHKLTIGGRFL